MTPFPDGPLLAHRKVQQVCWVVPALEPAIARWRAAYGLGPWLVVGSEGTENKRYRGESTEVVYRAALTQWGDIQLELLEQTSAHPSCFRDVVPEGRTGFHHVGFIAPDYDAELARLAELGVEPAFSAGFGDMRFCIADATETLGMMIEVYEDKPGLHMSMGLVRAMAADWDGVTDPVRRIEDVLAALEPAGA